MSSNENTSPAIPDTDEFRLTQETINFLGSSFWRTLVAEHYRLELEFRLWKCDLDNTSGPDTLKVFGDILFHPACLN